jgi:hypothetical protein
MTLKLNPTRMEPGLLTFGEYIENVSEASRIHCCYHQNIYDIKKGHVSQELDGPTGKSSQFVFKETGVVENLESGDSLTEERGHTVMPKRNRQEYRH